MMKLSTKIGSSKIQVKFKDMKSLHKFGSVYGRLPVECDTCGSDNLFLSFKNLKGNEYYMLECGDCKATANFGIHNNESKNLYWKNEKMTIYVSPQKEPIHQINLNDPSPKEMSSSIIILMIALLTFFAYKGLKYILKSRR